MVKAASPHFRNAFVPITYSLCLKGPFPAGEQSLDTWQVEALETQGRKEGLRVPGCPGRHPVLLQS